MFACTTKNTQIMSNLDVCKTPAPNGTVPVPYTNIGFTAQGAPVAMKVRIVGLPALNKKSKCAPSTGDEPGAPGGVRSSTIKGPVQFLTASTKVKLQGSPAVRQNDTTKHNQGNAVGSASFPCQSKVRINR